MSIATSLRSTLDSRLSTHSILRPRTGPLTTDLVQSPAAFGLGSVPTRLTPDATTTAVCGYCATGCGLRIHLKDGEAINLSADTDYPVNLGMACPKGWEALSALDAPDRATTPLRRDPTTGQLTPTDWSTAAASFRDNFQRIQRDHGPDSLAFLSTGQIVSEEMALLGAVAKFGMGIRHGDGNTRQCMATAVSAYKESFGFDAPPYAYADFEESDVIVLVGSNLCVAHPIMWQRVMRNPHNPRIIVIDPRRTETAMAATDHVALAPKSDLTLLYGLAKLLTDRGQIDRPYIDAHTTGFGDFVTFLSPYTLESTATATGLPAAQITALADTIATGKRVSFWWTMGVNQSHEATRTAQAIINLALMTGNLGRPGTGANSITGQCNAMGSRIFSSTTNLLGGHKFQNPADREKVADALRIPIDRIPHDDCLAYDQIIDGIETGQIKGLWVIATNTAHSWIQSKRAQKLLQKLDYLVVQDMYHSTETAQLADLVLPAAGWGEKDGTFINSERRIGLVKKVRRAPGQALSDFSIIRLLAETWGCGDLFREWTNPEAAFQIMKRALAGQPCDISGIRDYQHLDTEGGIQWPAVAEPTELEMSNEKLEISNAPFLIPHFKFPISKERRLFEDGRFHHPDGRARFIFESPRPLAEPPDADYPFTLLTGRGTSSQWHTQTRTGKSDVLRKLYPADPYVEIHPTDAAHLGIAAESQVNVTSRRGTITVRACVTPVVQPGQIFLPMHYGVTNELTRQEVDPTSRQPAYKACAVAIHPTDKP